MIAILFPVLGCVLMNSDHGAGVVAGVGHELDPQLIGLELVLSPVPMTIEASSRIDTQALPRRGLVSAED